MTQWDTCVVAREARRCCQLGCIGVDVAGEVVRSARSASHALKVGQLWVVHHGSESLLIGDLALLVVVLLHFYQF